MIRKAVLFVPGSLIEKDTLMKTPLSFFFFFLAIHAHTFCEGQSFVGLSNIKDPSQLIDNEISRLDTLIQATQQSLDGQKELKERIIHYQNAFNAYLRNSQDNEQLFQLIKSAYYTLKSIKENNLLHTFDSDFISELTMLSQFATKRGIPKP
jgi:hypothetical protein